MPEATELTEAELAVIRYQFLEETEIPVLQSAAAVAALLSTTTPIEMEVTVLAGKSESRLTPLSLITLQISLTV